MDISVTGMIGKRKEKAKLIEAAEFFAAQLMDPRMVRNLTLDIEVWKNFDLEGECVDEDGTKNPRWFTIGLKNQDIDEMIKVLGHEMVHNMPRTNLRQATPWLPVAVSKSTVSGWARYGSPREKKMHISMLLGR